jgi:molecular chaperone IbpA
MRGFDLTPLFRSTIGFDRLADMLDSVSQFDASQSYPPYNIERTDENHYQSLSRSPASASRTCTSRRAKAS